MKKIFFLLAIILFSFFSIANSQEREGKLNELFNKLKNIHEKTFRDLGSGFVVF